MKIVLKKYEINIFVVLLLASMISKLLLNPTIWIVTIICCFLYFMLFKSSKPIFIGVLSKEFLFFCGFGIAVLSTLLYQWNFKYIAEISINIMLVLLGYYMEYAFGDRYLKAGIRIICILLSVVCIFGIIEYMTKVNYFDKITVGDLVGYKNERIYGPFRHPIIYANCMLFALIGWVCLFKKSMFQTFMILLIICNIILTGSRSSWIGLLFLCLITMYRIYRSKKLKIKKTTFILYLILIPIGLWIFYKLGLISYVFDRTEVALSYNRDYQRTATIFYIVRNFFNGSIDNILIGNGSHAAAEMMLKVKFEWDNFNTTDNLYISDLYNYGLIYIAIILYYFAKTIKKFINNKMDELELMLEAVLISFFCVFFFYEPFVHYPVTTLFFISFGALLYKWRTITQMDE